MKIIGIVCINSQNRAIGHNNDLLFRLKKDMKFFKDQTTKCLSKNENKKNAVLMGSTTYLSIPTKFRPLPNRHNLVISNKNHNKIKEELKPFKNAHVFNSIEQAVQYAKVNNKIENLYIIGGQSIYEYFMKNNLYDDIFVTEVEGSKESSDQLDYVFFPEIPNTYEKTMFYNESENNVKYKDTNNANPIWKVADNMNFSFKPSHSLSSETKCLISTGFGIMEIFLLLNQRLRSLCSVGVITTILFDIHPKGKLIVWK